VDATGVAARVAARVAAQKDYERSAVPPEWADAVSSAKGLCDSEAKRWEGHHQKTAEHWQSVSVRLGALWLATDLLGVAAQKDEEQRDVSERVSCDCGNEMDLTGFGYDGAEFTETRLCRRCDRQIIIYRENNPRRVASSVPAAVQAQSEKK
jgi:hypothetical protein